VKLLVRIETKQAEAIEGAKTLKDEKLADYMHSHEFKTIMPSSWK
jgi:hypothetical protein